MGLSVYEALNKAACAAGFYLFIYLFFGSNHDASVTNGSRAYHMLVPGHTSPQAFHSKSGAIVVHENAEETGEVATLEDTQGTGGGALFQSAEPRFDLEAPTLLCSIAVRWR